MNTESVVISTANFDVENPNYDYYITNMPDPTVIYVNLNEVEVILYSSDS